MRLEVLEPGLLTTIQDLGRPEWTRLGVPIGGACDRRSLSVANLLVGNDPGAAAIEMTLVGPTLAVPEAVAVGLAGADLEGIVVETGRRLHPGRTHQIEAGVTLRFPGGDEGGAREYLAPAGGIDVPSILGSASTSLAAGFGGLDGRALRPADVIHGIGGNGETAPQAVWPVVDGDPMAGSLRNATIRLAGGPSPGIDRLVATEWRVGSASDRVGLRLDGPPIELESQGELLSHGIVSGAVQLPPGGAPIILLADHQTTGGYPIIAVAITADHPRLGQLRPGASVRFEEVSLAEAREALARQRAALEQAARMLDEEAGWEALWRSAGA